MSHQQVNIKEGTIEFWIREGKMKFDDSKFTPIVQMNPPDGGIFINKNEDNKIEFTHIYLGRGATKVEYDVSSLDQGKAHMFAVTWSLKNKEIVMYVDGKPVKRTGITYKD